MEKWGTVQDVLRYLQHQLRFSFVCLFVCLFVFSHCRPDGIGTITVDEKAWFEEIKIRLWNLLAYQITRYR